MIAGPFFDNGIARLYCTDARRIPLPDESVHFVVPPRLIGFCEVTAWSPVDVAEGSYWRVMVCLS